jgi:hypothetical protein
VKLELRRLRAGEFNHELIWLTVSLGVAFSALLWLKTGLPWPQCTFYRLTGAPCFTCGMTRAALAFLRGDFAGSWFYNPLAFVAFCAVAAYDLYALLVLALRMPRLRLADMTPRAHRLVLASAGVLVLANWVYLLNNPLL